MLAEQLLEAGCASYLGIDISERAIAMAKERNAGSDWCDKMIFTTGTIDEMPDKQADLVFSLGLFDWLGEEEIENLQSSGWCQVLAFNLGTEIFTATTHSSPLRAGFLWIQNEWICATIP